MYENRNSMILRSKVIKRHPPWHTGRILLAALSFLMTVALTLAAPVPAKPAEATEPTTPRARASVNESRMTWRLAPKKQPHAGADVGDMGVPSVSENDGVAQVSGEETGPAMFHDAVVNSASDVDSVSFDVFEPLPSSSGYFGESLGCDSCSGCDSGCDACGGSSNCGPVGLWVRAEYLLWSLDGSHLPALVTTSPPGTAPANIGVLGQNTSVLFGDNTVGNDARSGGRATLGWWTSPSQTTGFEVSYLGIDRDGANFSASNAMFPNLARPVFDTGTGTEASMLIAAQGTLTGSVNAVVENQLQAIELLHRQRISGSACHRLDWLIGYRYGLLDDRVRIDQSSTITVAQGPVIAGTTNTLFDLFDTENRFHGAQLGLNYRRYLGSWMVATSAKLGVGVNRGEVLIDGATVTTVPGGGSSTFVGGLLAQQTNIGRYSQSDFAVMPEAGISLIGNLNRSTQISIGYSLLYWSVVARAADQIDRRVSQFPPEPISGLGNPRFNFNTDGFLAHGLQAGLQFRF